MREFSAAFESESSSSESTKARGSEAAERLREETLFARCGFGRGGATGCGFVGYGRRAGACRAAAGRRGADRTGGCEAAGWGPAGGGLWPALLAEERSERRTTGRSPRLLARALPVLPMKNAEAAERGRGGGRWKRQWQTEGAHWEALGGGSASGA